MKHITEEEYMTHPGLSQSGAKELLRSPRHFQAYLERDREEQTPAQRIGSLVHLASLQPSVYDDTIVVAPDCDKRTKEGKEIWAAFQSALKPGQTAITLKESELVTDISIAARDAIAKVQYGLGPVEEVMSEACFVTRYDGVDIKGRPDLVTKIRGCEADYVIDIKTCQSADQDAFARDIATYKYHLQQAFYGTLCNTGRNFIIVAIEKEPPYAWRIYTLNDEIGRAHV